LHEPGGGLGETRAVTQIFRPRATTLARVMVLGAVLLAAGTLVLGTWIVRTPDATGVGVAVPQPVPFSHRHHAGELGIDCRYCHGAAERGASAGLPATETCMSCHAELWVDAPMLEPVRSSLASGEPITWHRVHDLPDHVYFDHSAHVHNGVGCASCHGRVDRMPVVHKVHDMTMRWCLECHRDPGPRLRPLERVVDPAWERSGADPSGEALVERYGIRVGQLADCTICHR
jgi:hypothetical protein